jgi:16S rRNA processing protein RimM
MKYIGTITRAHGLNGECHLADIQFLPVIKSGTTVSIGFSASFGKKFVLESLRIHNNNILLKLKGVNSISEVDKLREQGVFVDESDIALPDGEYYDEDIIGCKVYEESTGEICGMVVDVWQLPAYKSYVVQTPDDKEVVVPAVDEFVRSINPRAKTIIINSPEGLFEM